MQKRIQKWKRFLAIFLMGAMLLTNDYGVVQAIADVTREGDNQAKTNIELNAKVVVNNDDGVVDTGEEFQYELQYTVPNLTSGSGKYTGAKLTFKLPEYVDLVLDDEGKPKVSGPDYKSIDYNERTQFYTISFNDPLPMFATNTLTMVMKTNNLVTPDAVMLDFEKGFTFKTQFQDENGQSQEMTQGVKAGKIETNAESDWQITKENLTKDDGQNYKRVGANFEVTYRIQVKDEKGVDRLGRLGFESYEVVDYLPTALPEGGKAIEIKNVKLVRSTGNEDTAYTVTKDSEDHPIAITFTEYDTIRKNDVFDVGETSQYLEEGDTTNTTYEYTVVYPYAPYTTPADELDIRVYDLINTATLNYTLVKNIPGTDSDDAEVNIGAYEDNVVNANISVKKYVQFSGSEKELLDSATADKYNFTGDNTVKFTLYTDSECTNVAYNVDRYLMSNIAVDANGSATFNKIRKGTYYIKETSSHTGWAAPASIQVVVGEDGSVSYPAGSNEIINTATTINAVEFTKSGQDAYGNSNSNLGGATFTLSDGSNTFTATSDANGKVRFNNIPDGTYELKETAISSDLAALGYEISEKTFEVSVSGGAVVKPDLDGDNIYKNISSKGQLQIVKVDAQNENTKLSGAVFEMYGPYATRSDAQDSINNPSPKAATLTTGSDGKITSGLLEKGYYVLKETKAPVNYTAGDPVVVEVKARTLVTETITNDPQAKVYFAKKGAENNSGQNIQELYNVTFEIYNENKERLYGVQDINGNYTDVSTEREGRVDVTLTTKKDATGLSKSNFVTLSPGTYYYKETFVPEPYIAENTFVEFTVDQVAPIQNATEWRTEQTETIYNYLEKGQIRIQKTTDDNATTASALNGAVFGVYTDEACATDPVDTITTGTYVENGREIIGIGYSDADLDLNTTYYIKEISAPNGYALSTVIQSVRMTQGDLLVEVECENKRTVSIQITKEDSVTGAKLQNAGFTLYDANKNELATAMTDANGIVTFGGLDPNTVYYYKETTVPSGYVGDTTTFQEVTTGSMDTTNVTVEKTVTNDRTGNLVITKKDGNNNNFKAVAFKLYSAANEGGTPDTSKWTTAVKSGTTNNNGVLTFDNLTPGEYWLVETAPQNYETGKADHEYVKDATNGWKVVKINDQEYFYKKVVVYAGQGRGDGYPEGAMTVYNYLTKGKIQLKKYGANTDGEKGSALSGVVFGIYSSNECTDATEVTTITTDSNGIATSEYLNPGTYYVKEKSVPEGYIKADTIYIVEVVAGQTVKNAKVNDTTVSLEDIVNHKYGKLQLKKFEANEDGTPSDNPIKDVKFGIYSDANCTDLEEEITTDRNGVATSGYLAEGTYYVKETSVPTNYIISNTVYTVVVQNNKTVITAQVNGESTSLHQIVNDKYGKIKLQKFEANSDGTKSTTPIKDVKFTIYSDSQCGTDAFVQEITTGENGTAISKYLEPGTYYVKETSVPDNYILSNTVYTVVVEANKTTSDAKIGDTPFSLLDIVNDKYGKIELRKFEAKADGTESTTTIKDVEFGIYSNADCTELKATITTDNKGNAISDYLTPGTYYVKETKVPDGYVLSETVYTVEVVANQTVNTAKVNNNETVSLLKIVNSKKGTFTLNKKALYYIITNGGAAEEKVEALSGAVFTIYDANNNVVDTIDMSHSVYGSPTIKLEPGIYKVVETTVPDGYVKANDFYVQILEDGSVKFSVSENGPWETATGDTYIVNNTPAKAEIRVLKKNYYTGTLLTNAEFEVYKLDDDGVPTEVDGTVVNLSPVLNENNENRWITDAQGVILYENLENDTYYFKEIKAPSGYYFDPDDAWKIVTITGPNVYIIEYFNYPNVVGHKYKAGTTTGLSGAVLALFDSETDAKAMIDTLQKDYDEVTNPLTTVTDTDVTAWNIDQLVTSGNAGSFTFTNLKPGETYYIVELIAPTGYQLDYAIYTVKVATAEEYVNGPFSAIYKDAVKQSGNNLEVYNDLMHKILLEKKEQLSNQTPILLKGAEFTLYPSTETNGILSPDVENPIGILSETANGKHESILLPAGTYWLSETKIPDGYIEAERTDTAYWTVSNNVRYYKVELTRTQNNKYFVNNPVYNVSPQGKFVLTKVSSQAVNIKIEATFSVAKWNGEAFETYTSMPIITTPTHGNYTSEYLDPGIYKLTETNTESGYTMSGETVYIEIIRGKITDGTNSVTREFGDKEVVVYTATDTVGNAIKVTNDPKGKLFIQKTGTWNGGEAENLPGAVFDIYKKTTASFAEEPNREVVDTLITDSNGKATSKLLDAGEYWVLETGVNGEKADEYNKSADTYTAVAVEVRAGVIAEASYNVVNVVNTSNYGKFAVTKVDSVDEDVKISGATFEIYNNGACTGTKVGSMKGNNDGTYTSPRLPVGEYWLKETAAPTGYDNSVNNESIHGPYTVYANTLNTVANVITNEHDKSLTVYKYEQLGDTLTKTPISGVEFGLYKTQAEAEAATKDAVGAPIGGVKDTATDGTATWSGLTNGTYYLKELSSPNEYLPDTTRVHEITLDGKTADETFAYKYEVYNLKKGGFTLDKVITWTSGETTGKIPGSKITFKLYAADDMTNSIATLTTDENGQISYQYALAAGDYILVEQTTALEGVENAYAKPAPQDPTDSQNDGNYIDENGNIHIRVIVSETNTVFTGENAIANAANYGRFHLTKKIKGGQGNSDVNLSGAEYRLEKYVEEPLPASEDSEGGWVPVGDEDFTFTITETSGYTSGPMEPGKYRVIEIKAPTSIQNSNGVDVTFVVDPTPIEFEIIAGTTIYEEQFDGIRRDLKVTKLADENNDNIKLSGVTFELYQANEDADLGEHLYDGNSELDDFISSLKGADAEPIDVKTTGNDGTVVFTKLLPGKYLLVETVVPDGYEQKAVVLVVDESTSLLDVVHSYEVVNKSVKGRICIRKEDTSGNLITKDMAANAEFKIYAEADIELTNALDTVSVDNDGYALTKLLPVGKYWVVETKAPSGYTLDDRLLPVKKLVKVTGDQSPSVDFTEVDETAVDGFEDAVIFQNRTQSNTGAVYPSIQKLVRLEGETAYADDVVLAEDSLMFEAVTVEFKITNLIDQERKTEIPLEKFIVTDETLKFLDKNGAEIEELKNATSEDYVMNTVTIAPAVNTDTSKIVSADVYAKVGNKAAEWQLVTNLANVSETVQTVELPANTVAFKVEYSNADVGFTAGDVFVKVTFKQRESDPNVPQVRKVENTAVVNWEDSTLDRDGNPDHKTGTISDVAAVTFPVYDEKLPTLALKNDIVNKPSGGMYYSGGTIDFKTEGSVPETSPEDLAHPVMSINLPPYTSLDTTKYTDLEGGINGIRATLENGTICTFEIEKIIETNADGQTYEKYVLDFGPNFTLEKGDSITLEYTANIALDVPDSTISIESRGFIGSAKQLPLTAENPTGMSYRQADSDGSTVVSSDAGFDVGLENLGNEIAGDSLTYLRRPVHVELTRTDSRLIRKYVSTDGENWLTTETPTVKPGDNYYYKLTLVNGGDAVRRARIIDILPFTGDTQEFRAMSGGTIMSRATNLPSGVDAYGEYYEQVELVDVAPEINENIKATVYYYVESDDVVKTVANRDWTATNREQKTAKDELPMLTSNASAEDGVWAGWTTVKPADLSTVTAIGVEVEFLNEQYLSSGDDYNVVLTMRAPGYTAEQMNEYEDALIANTTAATVTQAGAKDSSAVTAIDRVSSNEVYTKLYITTGAIGDYAFFDNNDNGIQDEDDIPARNIPVTLYRRKSTTTMEEEPKWEVYKTTVTDQTTGMYWFDKLPCNYLDPNAKGSDLTDPANYIGNTYFEYYVEFGIPEGYAATIRYAGEDAAVDSNINEFGVTEPITLALTVGADGKLIGEENPTIDAGYVKLVNLGDYVWVDYNKNGVQDESEIGLNGVTVNLYKLESDEDTIEGKEVYRTTTTETKDDQDGYYLFADLPKGYYVVEFDLSTAVKETGYTQKFSFTVNDAGSDGADSDAAYVRGENDQIMYTEVIHLTEDDMTWDAGVTVYSALGGFVFDDQDYNDTQSIPTEVNEDTTANGIPLQGTVVTLYTVNEDGTMNPEPIGQQIVGEDGRYFFDKLDAGRYKVHFDYPDEYIGVKEGVGDYLHDSETKFFDNSTLNSGFTDIIELPEDTIDLTHDAGAYLLSAIGDYVWEDIDRDGIQDENEKPVKDITVTLQQKFGDGEWTTIETTTTDENGLYLFDGLKSSDHYEVQYRVAFAIPLTVELTGDNAGEDRAQDSNALPTLDVEYGYFTKEIILPYGQDDMTIDAGLYYRTELCEVGDYVWYDDDRDGIQDANEKGVEGIVVVLERCDSGETWNEEAWDVVGTTKTDANGKYIFTELQPGYYRVAFGVGDPWVVTIARVGDIALDSDAIRQKGEYYYTSSFYLNAGDSDMTWDAGIYKPSPKGTETGDNTNIGAWLCALGASVLVLVFMLKKRKEI